VSTAWLPGADDTIAAIATAPGRGALSVLRLSGARAVSIARQLVPELDTDAVRRAQRLLVRHPGDGAILDESLVTIFRAPHSYTGEDVVEISTHGGAVVPVLVLGALVAAGARQALPGEFTRRAVANGRMDLLQAEAVADLVDARSQMAHRVAINQLEGGLSRRAGELRDAILDVEALVAYDIDFPEEDEGALDRTRVTSALARLQAALDELLTTGNAGEMLREGALVVIGGAPNAGKSSLFNALVGHERAIVTDIPGTTRDAIEAVVEIRGWPVRLVDTAGLRDSTDIVERLGIEISERYLGNADLVLVCAESHPALEQLLGRAGTITSAPIVPVSTKSDLRTFEPVRDGKHPWVSVSTVTGEGLAALTERIASLLTERYGSRVSEAPLLTRERHRTAVAAARAEVMAFREAWERTHPPSSVAAVHLHEAAHRLSELIGTIEVEDVLGRIFSTFCVGK
jgi:tRNA modification GTPase